MFSVKPYLTTRLYNGRVTVVNQTFVDLLTEYIAGAHLVQMLPPAQVKPDNRYVWLVVNNDHTVFTALLDSQSLRYQHNLASVKSEYSILDMVRGLSAFAKATLSDDDCLVPLCRCCWLPTLCWRLKRLQ